MTSREAESLEAVHILVRVFAELGVRYFIGGSLASSVCGLPRSTLDVDVAADLRPEHAEPLARLLGGAFYVDPGMIREAAARRSSFHVIHLETMTKLGVFVLKPAPFDQSAFARAREVTIGAEAGGAKLRFATAEDVILQKLAWYKLGGEVSERQWNDVLGVPRVQGSLLDCEYMEQWAPKLGVQALLQRAMGEAGLGGNRSER